MRHILQTQARCLQLSLIGLWSWSSLDERIVSLAVKWKPGASHGSAIGCKIVRFKTKPQHAVFPEQHYLYFFRILVICIFPPCLLFLKKVCKDRNLRMKWVYGRNTKSPPPGAVSKLSRSNLARFIAECRPLAILYFIKTTSITKLNNLFSIKYNTLNIPNGAKYISFDVYTIIST